MPRLIVSSFFVVFFLFGKFTLKRCEGSNHIKNHFSKSLQEVAADSLTRGPYLQMLSSSGIHIRWRSLQYSVGIVKYGTSFPLNGTFTEHLAVTEHEVALSGLLPATKYFYNIGTADTVLQGDSANYFITAPVVGSISPFRFWALGDFGNGSSGQTAVRNAMESFTSGNRPAFWIWHGDNAYSTGADSSYSNFVFQIYPDQFKNIPVFPCLGNHDYGNTGYLSSHALGIDAPYFSIFSCPSNGEAGGEPSATEKYYSFDYGNAHFVVLDSYGSTAEMAGNMAVWLRRDLFSTHQRWKIVIWHHPPYTMGTHNSDTEIELIKMRNNIVPILEHYKVDLVMNGHSHVYERSSMIRGHYGNENTFNSTMYIDSSDGLNPYYLKSEANGFNGTVYVVNGCGGQGGVQTVQSGWPHAAMHTVSSGLYGSMILDISSDTLEARFLTSDTVVFDHFRMVKSGVEPEVRPFLVLKDEGKLVVYPVPVTADLHASFKAVNDDMVQVAVYDLDGKSVFSYDMKPVSNGQAGVYEITLPRSVFGTAGSAYILSVTSAGRVMRTKVEVE